MGTFLRERIRMEFNVEDTKPQQDVIAEGSPEMWRNNDVQFELGFFFDGEPVDASAYSSIKLIVKDQSNRNAALPLMKGVVSSGSITPTFTTEEWTSGSAQHCVIPFTAAETRLDLKGANEKTFWLAVIALTDSGKRITLGSSLLKLISDGDDEAGTAPPVGSSLVPGGAVYSGVGQYVLSGLTAGRTYSYTPAANDTNLTNGSEVLATAGNFVAAGTTATLNGTISSAVTAAVRYPVYATLDEMDARYQRKVTPWALSPNGIYMRQIGVTDDGLPYDQIIDLSTL